MQTDGGLLYSQIENQLPGFVQQNHTQFSKFVEKYYEFLELNLLTFTDLDLNEDSIIQESANTIYTVTVATGNNVYSNGANKFYIDDAVSPTLTLTTGTYAIFDQGDETNDTHYFRISTTPNGIHTAGGLEYVTDDRGDTLVTYEGTPADLDNIILETGTNGGGILLYEDETEIGYEIAPRVIFYVSPDLAGKSLYYYCNNHSGMGGNISVSNVTSYMVLDNGNTDSSNTSTDQVNLENPTRQGDQFLSGEIILGANSGATGVVRGKFSNTQVYLEETNNGSFQTGESIEGLTSRVTATVNNYSRQPLNASRNVKGFQDIDKAPKGFVELFRKEFLDGIPTSILADKDRILKNVKDFYRAKGNEASYQYIFRLLYDKQDVSFYYPSTDILRLSDGRWTLDKSLKIETAGANNITAFLGRTIQGGVTNVFALVERTETYQVGATSITELFLSDIDANNAAYNANTDSNYTTFNVNEKISTTTEDDDGNIGSANTTGVLASVSIDAGGSNYSVGDDLLITGGGGSEAAAKVGAVSDATISSIDIIDSGDGYTVGDTVSFINEGTGGTGGAARVQTIVKTAQVFTQSEIINSFKDDLLSASGFTDPWTSFTVNTHISSNSTTTFTVPFDGLSGDTPKSGDFIAKFGSGESITSYTPGGSKFGSVITANSTSITYALGSLNLVRNSLQAHSADPIANNFTNDDSVTIFDLTKDSSGSAKSANGHNAAFVATGGTFNINGTPTANTDTTYHGAGTFTESNVGGIRSIQVLSSGQGYRSSPVVSVANNEIEAYNAAEYVVGANSTFVNLANSIANTFTSNTIVKNASNSAIGIVLDFIDANTDLVATGNTTLRIQMTTAADFSPADVLTAYNRSDNSPVGIGDFGTANVSSDGVTATFTQADHGFEQGDRIVVSGASGTDTAVYNNNHTIDSVTNTSTYVVTLPSDPTDNDKDSVTVRLINTANVAYERMLTEDSAETQIQLESNGFIIVESGIDESNAIFANTGVPGNNAIIQISQIAIGAIQSVVVSNFGAGFTSAPTINASAKGDGNATLTGNLGALAEYEGYFDGNYGLLSTTNKLQDNYYYQDFSYVIKTDVDVATYRDKIIELVHPAGMALFGEVSMIANTSVRLFNDATNNVETVIANTTHGIDVPLYRHRDIEIMSVNAENVQVNTTSTLMKPNLFPPTANRAIDAKIDTTGASFEFDVQLEHGHDLISLEIAESIFVYENSGEILLEQDLGGGVGDRLIGETSDILVGEDDSLIIQENIEEVGFHIATQSRDQFGISFDDGSILLDGVIDSAKDPFFELEGSDGRIQFEDGEMLLSENTVEHNTFLLANVIIAGGRIQEDGPEGQLILQEDESFILSEDYEEENDTDDGFRQIRLENNQLLLNEDQPVPYFQDGHIDTNVEFLEMEKGEAVANVHVELEQSDGGSISVRSEFLTRFVLEEDSTDMVKILDEVSGTDNFQHEEFHAALVQEESDSIQLERSDGLLITEDNDGIQLEEADSTTDPTPAFFLFENDDADARGYVLTEPELVSSHIVSENDADTFVIRMEQDGTFFFIRQESELGADFGDFILLEDVGTSDSDYDGSVSTEGRLMGFTNPTSRPDRMSLEKDEYIEDTNLKGEHYEPGTGFFLPKLQFPLAETGASKIDFSFTSNLLIEIDDIENIRLESDAGDLLYEDEGRILYEQQPGISDGYIYDLILLEESDGINPMYIALENSMTEEVDVGTELELLLVDDDHQLHLESGGVLLHENGGIGLEDSVDNVRLESSEGMLLQEDGISVIVFESGSQDGDNFANVILAEDNSKIFLEDSLNDVVEVSEPVKASATVKAGVILTDTGHTLNEGNFQVQGTGRVQLRGAGSFELLDEDGNHLVAEQSSDTFKNFTTESDNPYILEQSSGIDTSFLVSDILVEEAESIRFISASYLRQNDAIGTDTKFESEFSAVIILEAETGVVLLEEGTSQDNLICQENSDDKIFEPIQIEESGTLIGNLAAEDDFQKDTARLVLNDLHDLILEEEAIALEEEDHILQEDFTSGDAIKSLLTEGGDNLVLQHADHNLATEEIIGLDNFVQEDRTIDSFTPLLGLEPDNLSGNGGTMDDQGQIPPNIVLEDGTNKTENLCIVMEDTIINSAGGRIGYEDTDGNEESHVLLEDDTGGKVVTEDFFRVTELGEFVVQEGDGVSKIVQEEFYYKQWSEGQIQQTGTTVTIASGRLPHGIHEGGQLRYANGLHTKITSMGSLNEEFEVENSATISTAQNYRILYGVDDTAYNKEVFVSLELNTLGSSGANDAGRQYQFTPDGIVGHEDLDGLGTFTLTPFLLDQRHGNDIVYEDGERILHEDGELTQDENVILLEVNDVLILEDSTNENHNSLLLETGGEIFLEETNQDSEFKLSMESNDVVMLENPVSSFDFRLLNMDGARFRIGLISNSTFMTVDSTETFFERPDSPIIIERAERIV